MSATTKKAGKEKTSTRIVPLGDRVVLKRASAESKTKGGIVLPDTAKDKPQKGEVIAVGDGYIRDDGSRVPLTVKEGDDVIFSAYGGEEYPRRRGRVSAAPRERHPGDLLMTAHVSRRADGFSTVKDSRPGACDAAQSVEVTSPVQNTPGLRDQRI